MENVSLALAFAAGLISFISPCVLALVPVYLAFLGESATGGGARPGELTAARGGVLPEALLFVAGFSAVFIVVGTSVGLLGGALFRVPEARQVAGVLVIGLGVVTTGAFGPVLDRLPIGIHGAALPAARPARALALGGLVAIGWSPCIGPVLGTILMMGASSQSAPVAALLLVAYSAGLAVPFLAAAVALPRMRPLLAVLGRHHRLVALVSGLFIVAVGILIFVNAFAGLARLFTLGI